MNIRKRFERGFLRLGTPKQILNASLAVMAGASLLVGASIANSQTIPANPQMLVPVPPPMFASWFTAGVPSLNGAVNPADSLNFSNIPNGDFYRWSWQMFLWLLSPAPKGYGGGGFVFTSPVFFDVSPPDSAGIRHFKVDRAGQITPNEPRTLTRHVPGKPIRMGVRIAALGPHNLPIVVTRSGKVYEIAPQKLSSRGRALIRDGAGNQIEVSRVGLGKDGNPVLFDTSGKQILNPKATVDMSKIPKGPKAAPADPANLVQQFTIGGHTAFFGPSGKIMEVEVNQAANGVLMSQGGSLVYYASMVNDVFAYFLTGTKNGGIPPTPQNSVVVGPNTIFRFPTDLVGLTEVTNFASANGFTIVDPNALAVELKTSWVDASTVANPSQYVIRAGIVPTYDTTDPNHWKLTGTTTMKLAMVGMHVVGSTRGHPEMLWATFEHFGSASNAPYQYINNVGVVVPGPFDPGPWMFSTVPGGPFNIQHMSYDPSTGNIDSIVPFTVSPSDTQRIRPWGMPGASSFSNTEIISIDRSVLTQLIPGDIRANYFMTGTTWTIGGAPPNGGNEVGTNVLANTTMETYQQTINCFACHQSTFGSPVSTTDISHIFGPLKPLF